MPNLLDTLVSGIAHVPPRAGMAGTPHETPLPVSLVIFGVLAAVATLMLMATFAAI